MLEIRADKNGNGFWVEGMNLWTGSHCRKRFSTEEKARAYIAEQERLRREEDVIFAEAKKRTTPQEHITVRELIKEYIEHCGNSELTIRMHTYHCASLLRMFGDKEVLKLCRADIFAFYNAHKIRGLADITVRRRVSILRAAVNWGIRNDIIPYSPIHGIVLPCKKGMRIAPPTIKEVTLIAANAKPHIRRMVILGIYTGARIGPSELFRLRWDDIDFETKNIHMPSAHKSHLEEARDVPIRTGLLPWLREWREIDSKKHCPWVLSWGGKAVKNLGHGWRAALRRAGITRRIRPYDLRHAFATYALANGADIGAVARIMGHTDASMILDVYQHVQESQKRKAVEAPPDFFSFGVLGDLPCQRQTPDGEQAVLPPDTEKDKNAAAPAVRRHAEAARCPTVDVRAHGRIISWGHYTGSGSTLRLRRRTRVPLDDTG